MFRMMAVSLVAALSAMGPVGPESANRDGTDPVKFTIRVENVSKDDALKLSSGGAAPAPTAPTLWLVHTGNDALFTAGKADRGLGLEHLAEDGDPSSLAAALHGKAGTVSVGFVNTPQGDGEPGPITPGKAYEFTVTAQAGQKLTLAFMFGQSNDLFYSPGGEGIALFDRNGKPVSGDVTKYFQLWDAGTEINQEPGAGADQAPRQKSPNTGASESKPIGAVKDAFTYPKATQVIRVTVLPAANVTRTL